MIDVKTDETIYEWKFKIFKKLGTPMCAMFLVFAGKILDETKTICDYNLAKESTIHLIEFINKKIWSKVLLITL